MAEVPSDYLALRAGSLCTGIGGLDLAAEAHFDCELAWYSEVEPAPSAVLEREWRGVPNLGDLTTVDWSAVEPVDVLTAGYPCQPFSHAGRRKGTDDHRHLWPHVAAAVRHLRPRWVVLENVAGHLSLGFDEVLGDLAEAGFDAEWCVLRASDVGAPHQRARLFMVARDADITRTHPRPTAGAPWEAARQPGGSLADASGAGAGRDGRAVPRAPEEGGWAGADVHAAGDAGAAAPDAQDLGHERGGDAWRRGPGPTDRCDAATDPESERRGRCDEPRQDVERDGLQPPLVGEGADRGDTHEAVPWGAYAPAIARWEALLGRPAPRPTDDRGRLSPPFVEWMMGYPEGWVAGLTRTQALKALGNAVVPQQGLAALRELAPIRQEAAA